MTDHVKMRIVQTNSHHKSEKHQRSGHRVNRTRSIVMTSQLPITKKITVNYVTEHGCAIHYKQKCVLYNMNRRCNMLVAYFMMLIVPFSGDIFSSAAQMTVKTVIPIISG